MKYLKIYNPLDEPVKTGYLGQEYVLEAKESRSLPADVVERFVGIYPFLEASEITLEKEVKEVVAKVEKEVKKAIKK